MDATNNIDDSSLNETSDRFIETIAMYLREESSMLRSVTSISDDRVYKAFESLPHEVQSILKVYFRNGKFESDEYPIIHKTKIHMHEVKSRTLRYLYNVITELPVGDDLDLIMKRVSWILNAGVDIDEYADTVGMIDEDVIF